MNWEAIGVIAELLGATAVVVTLLYLAVQMRLAREATQVQSTYSTIEVYANWRGHLIENGDLAGLVAKANRGEELSDKEDIQVSTLMDDLFAMTAMSHASNAKADAFYESASEVEYVIRLFDQNPGLTKYWNRTREFLEIATPDYARAVDIRLKQHLTQPVDVG